MEETQKECPLCHDTKCLSQWGILVVYLLAAKVPLLIMLVSLLAAISCSPYFYLLFAFGLVLPLAHADLRLYLYPVAAILKMAGKKLNCPECNSNGAMLRNI